ncbi:MAG: PTS sugar transporter subunit IIB [Erysipelotrichaceae bacterium]|nr:PTS sugar transporter subunit IIB [Erysipelotrichaceae bacterium]
MAAKMRYAAKAKGLDLNLTARSEGEISNFIGDIDAIMVGPHLSGNYERLETTYGDVCKIILMKKEYYGNLDGEKAIEHLLEELKLK